MTLLALLLDILVLAVLAGVYLAIAVAYLEGRARHIFWSVATLSTFAAYGVFL